MTINQRVFYLFETTGKKEADLAHFLGIGTGQTSQWKTRGTDPPAKYITLICQFFNITPEYLLTGQDPLPKELTSDEAELVSLYRKLEPTKQLEYRAELKGYAKAKEEIS